MEQDTNNDPSLKFPAMPIEAESGYKPILVERSKVKQGPATFARPCELVLRHVMEQYEFAFKSPHLHGCSRWNGHRRDG